jgi:hypothetical protein
MEGAARRWPALRNDDASPGRPRAETSKRAASHYRQRVIGHHSHLSNPMQPRSREELKDLTLHCPWPYPASRWPIVIERDFPLDSG